jgi:hypothetical protein
MTGVVKYLGKGGTGFGLSSAADVPCRSEALRMLSRPAGTGHPQAKRVSADALWKVDRNKPFEDYPRAVYGWKRAFDGEGEDREEVSESYWQAVENFLRRTFHSLTFIPEISFDVRSVSEKSERKAFNAALARYRAAKMAGQAALLKELYDGLCALRIVLRDVSQNSLLETVIPVRFLPELFLASPVWFINYKGRWDVEDREFERATIRYFCDLGVTDQFAYLFQLYNIRVRHFDEFSGRDIMPLYIIDLIREVRRLFDYLVIATPYHDMASAEWGEWKEAPWVRNVDPFLLGFVRQVPELVFCLGRWSGRALFPRIGDMIADTIDHLDKGKALLANTSEGGGRWYKTETRVDFENTFVGPRLRPVESYSVPNEGLPRSKLDRERWRKENHSLVRFANTVRGKFEEGNLFTWLRGESDNIVNFR